MNYDELDKYLRELDKEEKVFKELSNKLNDNLIHREVKKVYSLEKHQKEWVINSKKLMKQGENFAIHKHKRFVMFPEHKHDYMEIVYVLNGEIKQKINEEEVYIKQGELCILDLNVSHSIEPSRQEDIAINIIMEEEFFDGIFMSFLSDNDLISNFIVKALNHKREHKEYLHFHCGEEHFIKELIKRILCEYFDKDVGSDTAIHSYILLLFTELLRNYRSNMGEKKEKQMNKSIVNNIIKYLSKNFKTATLKETANFFHFNPDYLSKLIKSHTGLSFTSLLQEIRLNEATLYLRNSKQPVDEVVREVGYANVSHFYKLFKQKYNLTPVEYRRINNEGE